MGRRAAQACLSQSGKYNVCGNFPRLPPAVHVASFQKKLAGATTFASNTICKLPAGEVGRRQRIRKHRKRKLSKRVKPEMPLTSEHLKKLSKVHRSGVDTLFIWVYLPWSKIFNLLYLQNNGYLDNSIKESFIIERPSMLSVLERCKIALSLLLELASIHYFSIRIRQKFSITTSFTHIPYNPAKSHFVSYLYTPTEIKCKCSTCVPGLEMVLCFPWRWRIS